MHIYIHIPFCKQACHYCDFHFSTNLSHKTELVQCIAKEIKIQNNFLNTRELETIYFGGGSPSLLSLEEFKIIFTAINQNFIIKKDAEITLEVNPDDVNPKNISTWKNHGFNRISLGIQSFDEETLKFMNRAHNSQQAKMAISLITKSFNNVSVDLIYNRNNVSIDEDYQHKLLKNDLEILAEFKFNHLSAYSLTIEPKTVFNKWQNEKKIGIISDEYAIAQHEILQKGVKKMGFEQYETSSFAKNQAYAKHNTAYWNQKAYLGIGPGAHSFDLKNRYANVSNNAKYIRALNAHILDQKTEILSPEDKFNELILCGLRTKWGFNLNDLELILKPKKAFYQALENFKLSGDLSIENSQVIITDSGRIITDGIAAELFW